MHTDTHWFDHEVLYQIYPRSFCDSNGDGVGDIRGIIGKLDYLKGAPGSLGVGAVWLSPFYPSPMADFGYDVSDYCDVDPLFGTLDDFRELLTEAHKRDIRLIIDFIPNHTSDQHAWFQESRSSRTDPKRDWYVWHDGVTTDSGQAPPNNWQSEFGGPAWTYDEPTGQYYLHSFLSKQPDLNWHNPAVRQAMKEQMRFWLDMGVDGFRVDAVSWLSKDRSLQDNPANISTKPDNQDPEEVFSAVNSQNGPHLYDYLREMAELVDSYPEKFMITEAYPHGWDNTASYMKFYNQVDPAACAPFNFEAIAAPWVAASYKGFIDRFQAALQPTYIPIYCQGNHDKSRLASRIGPEAARTAAMLALTLPGMPVIYNGDELGMTDGQISPEQVRDPFANNTPGQHNGRDPERTPLAWDNTPGAGFTSGQPWLPINQSYVTQNVAAQSAHPASFFSLYRQLIALRASSEALKSGRYVPQNLQGNVFGFERSDDDEKLCMYLNFSDQPAALKVAGGPCTVVLSTYLDDATSVTSLRPHEGIIVKVA